VTTNKGGINPTRDPNRDMTIVRVERIIRYEGPRWWVQNTLSRRVTGRMKMGQDGLVGEYVEELSITPEEVISIRKG